MRRLLLAAAFAAAVTGSLGAGSASAYCDEKYEPLCLNDCVVSLPEPRDPLAWVFRVCPR